VKAAALVVCMAGALTIAPPASADVPLSGIPIGASVRAIVPQLGEPSAVVSADNGQRFVFAGDRTAYTDDDGIVLAVETGAGTPQVDVDGPVRSFPIGSYTTARADAELAGVAEFSTPGIRSFRLAPRRDLVLEFGPANRLKRVAYGEPGQLARLGLLPGDAATKAVVYRAPQLRPTAAGPAASPAGDAAAPLTTVYRIAIDRAGSVKGAEVFIPSALPEHDAEPERGLVRTRYVPATLDGRPIAATVFIELRHG
jgi:hypothetical protein